MCPGVCHALHRQKVSLWQHADELEQEMVAKGNWIDSSDVDCCMGCSGPFGLFSRKVGDVHLLFCTV